MLRRWLSSICALLLALTPAAAQEAFMTAPRGDQIPSMHGPTCVSDTADATTYNGASFQAVTIPGVSDGDLVMVVVIVLSEDSASTFGVNSMTIDGGTTNESFDQGGTGVVNTAIYRTLSPLKITSAGSLNISVTHSEAVTSARICVWAFKWTQTVGLPSGATSNDSAGALMTFSNTGTVPGGFVVGGCISAGTADSTTWGVLNEKIDTQDAEADYSAADAPSTGGTMTVTCDWTGTNNVNGGAAGLR